MSHKANTGVALPSDADQGVSPHPDHPEYMWFQPSDARTNALSFKLPNADMTPVGFKGVWLADFCQEVLRSMGLSQRRINQMYINLVWINGDCEPTASSGFAFGSHTESPDIYNAHDIKISVGAVVEGEQMWFNRIKVLKTITHELIHAAQMQEKRLHYTHFGDSVRYTFKAPNGNKQTGWVKGDDKILTAYEDLPYEMEAWGNQSQVMQAAARKVPDQECLGYDPLTQKPSMTEKESMMLGKWQEFLYNLSKWTDWC